jgi:primosomal protein N'
MDPYVKNPSAAANPGPFAEGDRVLVPFRPHPVEGIVVEDRGNLGVGGRRMYRVRIQLDDVSDPYESTWPAEELTLVAKAPAGSRKRRKG